MKKFYILLLCLILCLTGCTTESQDTTQSTTQEVTQESTQVEIPTEENTTLSEDEYNSISEDQAIENAEEDSSTEDPTASIEPVLENPLNLEKVTVLYYVDGDTIWVTATNGENQKVRFIGVCCEESASKDETLNTEGGAAATDFVKTLFEEGDTIYLQRDVSDTDLYGRQLRYVWLEYPESLTDETEIRTKMLNAIIIMNGYAKVGYYKPDVSYYTTFKMLQTEAKENNVGLWAEYWK